MKKVLVISLFILAALGCQQKEAEQPQYKFPGSQYQVPTGPLQAKDDIKLLKDLLKKDPGNLNAWINLGNALMDTARCTEAVDAYQKALDIDPAKVDVRVDMGTCYRRIGMPDRAVEQYRKALKSNPAHPYGHMNLGIVLAYDLGKYPEAIKEFEKYLELSPNAPNADDIKNEIKRLKAAGQARK